MIMDIYLLIGTVVFIIDLLRAVIMEDQDKSVWIVFRGMLSIFMWPMFVIIRILPLIMMILLLVFIRLFCPTNESFYNYLKEY